MSSNLSVCPLWCLLSNWGYVNKMHRSEAAQKTKHLHCPCPRRRWEGLRQDQVVCQTRTRIEDARDRTGWLHRWTTTGSVVWLVDIGAAGDHRQEQEEKKVIKREIFKRTFFGWIFHFSFYLLFWFAEKITQTVVYLLGWIDGGENAGFSCSTSTNNGKYWSCPPQQQPFTFATNSE